MTDEQTPSQVARALAEKAALVAAQTLAPAGQMYSEISQAFALVAIAEALEARNAEDES